MDLNVVAITGRLTADPTLHSTANGTDVTTLRVAISRPRRQSEQRADADFVDVVVWGEQAKHAAKYLAKGRRVGISGRLQQRTWTTPEGSNRSRLQVVAEQVQFLDPRNGHDAATQAPAATTPTAPAAEAPAQPPAEPTEPLAEQAPATETPTEPTADTAAKPAAGKPRRTRKAANK
ncbi:MAG TPA: single-stranded DNA-binding protein [Actinomycetes bacterium]|jgi:single-strand DNA-binding protein